MISLAAILGATVVALGAFGAHALKGVLDPYSEAIYSKAVLYHMFHTMALLATGIVKKIYPALKLERAGIFFTAGIGLFSGSLYLLAVTGIKKLGMITPLGGISFILGWFLLAYTLHQEQKKNPEHKQPE